MRLANQDLYRQWAAGQPDMPIFLRPWWLDAVCAGKYWDAILVYRDDRVIAAMPFLYREKWGGLLRYVLMPQQTQIGGVWMEEGADPDYVTDEVIRQLEALHLDYYYQQFPLRSQLPQRFASRGFSVRERVTYCIEDLGDMASVYRHLSKNKSRQLKKALDAGLVADHSLDAEQFYRLHRQCLSDQRRRISYSREFLLVLERKTRRLDQSTILAVRHPNGDICAAAYLVWDSRRLYYLIPFYNPRYRELGAGTLLAIEAMKVAKEKGLAFDFEGSMVHSIARHYRQMGGDPSLYYSVEKYYRWWFVVILKIRSLLHKMHK